MKSKLDTRNWLSNKFESSLREHTRDFEIESVAIVGGGPDEPELQSLTHKSLNVSYFGIEKPDSIENFYYVDLNMTNKKSQKFDLVICNQVIEHLYKLQNAFETIGSLVKPGGLLWITAPASNFRHGSPHYYSAGFSREFLAMNLKDQGFESLEIGELSCKRVYHYRHLLKIWPTAQQITFPIFSYFGVQGTLLDKISFNLKHLPARLLIMLASDRWEIDGDFPIETFGLFRKMEKSY